MGDLVKDRIEKLRLKLLDLSRRNPLLSTSFSVRSNAVIRVIDQTPDYIFKLLRSQKPLPIVPLPPLGNEPADENSIQFQEALSIALVSDEAYNKELRNPELTEDGKVKLERALKDRLRDQLGLPPRQTTGTPSLALHAESHGICPDYELPFSDQNSQVAQIQTLLLPDDLARKLNGLRTKYRTTEQETGVNALYAAFGFLEWSDDNDKQKSINSPLILLPLRLEKEQSGQGAKFLVKVEDDKPEVNTVLREKLASEFDVKLPDFNDDEQLDDYFNKVSKCGPAHLKWKVKRQVSIGLFPSARMAMFADLSNEQYDFGSSAVISTMLIGSDSHDKEIKTFAADYEVDQPLLENKVPLVVLDADSSQYSTLIDFMDGKNLAVEGPPGSGKSQTIVNAIAAALSQGKKVLFVAEKTAALDVVKSRLDALGLGEFVLPLQAGRSSREQVKESIKDRRNMDTGNPISNYDQQLEERKKRRDELKRYIDSLSSTLGQTGLKVYDILGQCLVLGKIPSGLQDYLPLPNIEQYDESMRERVLKAAHDLETAIHKLDQAKCYYWEGIKVQADPITVDTLINMATDASNAFNILHQDELKLEALTIPGPYDKSSKIEKLRQAVDKTLSQLPHLDLEFTIDLGNSGAVKELRDFFKNCEVYQHNVGKASHLLKAPEDSAVLTSLEHLVKLSETLGIEILDIQAIDAQLEALKKSLNEKQKYLEELKCFLNNTPEAASFSLSALNKATELAKQCGHMVLAARNKELENPANWPMLTTIYQKVAELREARQEAYKLMPGHLACSAQDLLRLAAQFKDANFFTRLLPGYRRARKEFLALSSRDSFEKSQALSDLTTVADFKNKEHLLANDKYAHDLLGIHFKGCDTDFAFVSALLSFYQKIENDFQGVADRDAALRSWLKQAPTAVLMDIPIPCPELASFSGNCTQAIRDFNKQAAAFKERSIGVAKFKELALVFKNPYGTPTVKLIEVLNLIKWLHDKRQHLKNHNTATTLLKDKFKGHETAVDCLQFEIDFCSQLEQWPNLGKVIFRLMKNGTVGQSADALKNFEANRKTAHDKLHKLSSKSGLDFTQPLAGRSPQEISQYLQEAAQDRQGLYDQAKLKEARQCVDVLGIRPVTEAIQSLKLNDMRVYLERLIYQSLAKKAYDLHGAVLGQYSGFPKKLDDLRKEFASLDRELISISKKKLRYELCARAKPPVGIGKGLKSGYTDLSLLDHEISKTKQFLPIRDLLSRAGKALLELKPCWMMSPLAVAQYLPLQKDIFDVCILDEASQMPPENAIGTLARCRQAMIVGDTNQLPPSNFFKSVITNGDEGGEGDGVAILDESILEMANASFRPPRRLRWHYRSRHASLINFSNHYVYGDELVIFPSAADKGAGGVSLFPVAGSYLPGSAINPVEAEKVVTNTLSFMRYQQTKPEAERRSLGIVTLNQSQRDLLLEEFDRALANDKTASDYVEYWEKRKDGLESFFIKNLENVQGDERDVIFISTVYGPQAPGGPVMQRFGPINGIGGKRRLNVLFTRAKWQVVTFSSMTSNDIRATPQSNPGAFMLKSWLEYCGNNGNMSWTDIRNPTGGPDSAFECYVIKQIESMGLEAVPQVGVSGYRIDIGLRHPDWPHGYIMGVECDGATYHSSASARDRDRLRQEVLEGLGWKLHRIWSTSWFADPKIEADRLRKAVKQRLVELKSSRPPVADDEWICSVGDNVQDKCEDFSPPRVL